jgi:hypothetical protein
VVQSDKRAAKLALYAVSHFPGTMGNAKWSKNAIIWKRISVRQAGIFD